VNVNETSANGEGMNKEKTMYNCEDCKHSRLSCSACLRRARAKNTKRLKPETEQILISGWYIKGVMEQRPELGAQLSHLIREVWEMAATVQGCAEDELNGFLLPRAGEGLNDEMAR
jgi:glycerol dehydrogenase-like iron-containing ADH family enzyme